jgi:hypothetical protein
MIGDKKQYIQDTGDWLRGLLDWNLYGTLTFTSERTPESARRAVKDFINYYDPTAKYIMVVAPQSFRSCPHIHFLLKGLTSFRRLYLIDKWAQKYGFARIYLYDKNKGGAHYIAKHLRFNSAELEVVNV